MLSEDSERHTYECRRVTYECRRTRHGRRRAARNKGSNLNVLLYCDAESLREVKVGFEREPGRKERTAAAVIGVYLKLVAKGFVAG